MSVHEAPFGPTARFAIVRARSSGASTLADDVREGLARAPRSLPPKHFYDAHGSRLFERICGLPEYYPTRAEHALLVRHADAIARMTRATTLVEIGSGAATKTPALLRAIGARTLAPLYVPLDIAHDALARSAAALTAAMPSLSVRGVVGEFPRDLPHLAVAAPRDDARPRLFALLGGTIGNLDEREAPALLRAIADLMSPCDAFLLGMDLVKDERALVAAYDDAQGVTALFNKNVLAVINRELSADFDLDAFAHEAIYDRRLERIEMRLVSKKAQRARIQALGMTVELCVGERILTEISRKFTRESARETLERGNMRLEAWYEGPEPAFALCVARRAA